MKKKILFLEARFDSFYGAQQSMLKLIESLDEKQFSFKVVTTKDGKLKKSLAERNIPVDIVRMGKKTNAFGGKVLHYSIFGKTLVLFQMLIYNLKMITYIQKNNIDIIYVNDLRALLYSIIATKIMRKKNVWYIRADVTDSKLTNIGLKLSDNVITIAKGVLRNLPQHKIKKYKYKISNIYTGFKFNSYQIFDKSVPKHSVEGLDEKLTVGYLGSINQRKGIDLLVDSFIEVSKEIKGVELLIVGGISPGHEKYWENQIEKLRQGNFSFKYIPFSSEISQMYSKMDVFVLPSRSEGLPRVVIEAMGHQLPVIATDVGGVKEIILDESMGIIIEKDDKKALVTALKRFLINPIYRADVSKVGQRFVKSNFSEKIFVRKVNDYFKKLL